MKRAWICLNIKYQYSKQPFSLFPTVPCVPVPLNPTLNCTSGAVTVSWQPSSGTTSYRALAQGSGGYPSSCNSNSTTCVFTGLLCGLNYNFTVSASDSICTSIYSSSVQLNTGTTHMPVINDQGFCPLSEWMNEWILWFFSSTRLILLKVVLVTSNYKLKK